MLEYFYVVLEIYYVLTFITLGVKYLNIICLYNIKMPKLCEFETCRNRATYGLNCDPLKCKEHKEDNMKLSSTVCKCGKQPCYNLEGLKAKFCASCKPDGAIDVKNKICLNEGCSVQANFNYEEEQMPIYCFTPKKNNMINIKNKDMVCVYEDCKIRANYNLKGNKNPLYCTNHKTSKMINVTHPFCEFNDCLIIPAYNYENEKKPLFCFSHKLQNMVNVVSKICLEIECKKRPSFNYIDCKEGIYCYEHSKPNMVNVLSKKCIYNNCNIEATFNFENEKKSIYCVHHKLKFMIDIRHPRCKADNCQTRANKNYKDYCGSCFQHLFPLDPLTFQIRCKTKEIAVRDFINTKFEGFQHDKPLWYNESACDCTTKRRIDHRKLINGTLLCIETDENQHKGYSKQDEESRYHDLFMAYGGKFVFIRFNPDKYKDENGKSCNPMLFNRLIVLEEEINKHIKRIENDENNELLEVVELYYDKK